MWVVEKIRVSVERTNLPLPSAEYSFRMGDLVFGDKPHRSQQRRSLCPNVITPDTIPEFCIPPTFPSLHLDAAKAAGEFGRPAAAPVIRVSPCERRGGGGPGREATTTAVAARELISPHIIQVESVDEGPYGDDGDDDGTDADPQSQAALSLPHLAKAQTCYGFCTLLESPHTRRKESLFHNDPGVPLLFPRSRSGTFSRPIPSTSPSSAPHASFSLNTLASRLSPRGYALYRQGTVDSDTTSSAESSPYGSPLLARSLPKSSLFKALSHERLLSQSARKGAVSRNNSLSTDEGSSTDNSPNVMRRASEGLVADGPTRSFGLAPPPTIFPMDLVLHRDRVAKESLVPMGKDGVLRLSAEYCPDNQRLRVRLISAEGLYALSVDPKSINCSVSLSLVPGKVQKQRSTVIRKSRNPIFNEDFFFDGVSEEDLCQRSLRFKVVNKMSTMKRDYILGDCELLLTSIITL